MPAQLSERGPAQAQEHGEEQKGDEEAHAHVEVERAAVGEAAARPEIEHRTDERAHHPAEVLRVVHGEVGPIGQQVGLQRLAGHAALGRQRFEACGVGLVLHEHAGDAGRPAELVEGALHEIAGRAPDAGLEREAGIGNGE